MLGKLSSKSGVVYLIAVVALLAAAAFAWSLRQSNLGKPNWFPKCILHQATGLHCIGCGATRAVQAILRGDVIAAIRFNPVLILGGPVIAVLLWRRRKKERQGIPVSPYFTWCIFAFVVTYSIARNVPSPTRSWLAPPEVVNEVGDE